MNDFDPIPRLEQIAATIHDSGSRTFYSPATAAHYINCAIKEIEKLRQERDEMQGELRKTETECSMLRVECGVLEKNAEVTYENHKRIVAELTAGRDEAREQAERWEDDALRLMQERNAAERERDDARFTAAYQYANHHNGDLHTLMDNFCKLKGWEKIRFFGGDDDHTKEGL